jgi:hypothetical protein
VSLLLFVVVFAVVLYRVIRMKAADAEGFAAMPLDPAPPSGATGGELSR